MNKLLSGMFLAALLILWSFSACSKKVEQPQPAPPPKLDSDTLAPETTAETFDPNPNRPYIIIGRQSGRCMDIAGGAEHALLQIYDCSAVNNNQKFWFKYDSSIGGYEIRADHSSQCLDVYGNSPNDGNRIQQFPCNNKPNQRWKVVQIDATWYQIRPMQVDGKCADVANRSVGNKSEVHQWVCNQQSRQDNQEWRFEPTDHFNASGGGGGGGGTKPEAYLADASKCVDQPGGFGYKNCSLMIENKGDRDLFVPSFSWSGLGVKPGPFPYGVEFQNCVVKAHQILDLHENASTTAGVTPNQFSKGSATYQIPANTPCTRIQHNP